MRGALQSPAVSALSFCLACIFHEIFRKGVIEQGVTPLSRGAALSQRQRECLELAGLPLSRRELQCLQLAAHGMTNSDIARSLDISERTVQFHCSNILTKLNVLNRGEAIATGITTNLITL